MANSKVDEFNFRGNSCTLEDLKDMARDRLLWIKFSMWLLRINNDLIAQNQSINQ